MRSRCEELALTPAVEPVSGEGDQERRALAEKLAAALEKAGELELLETSVAVLDAKRGREELAALLDELADQLTARATREETAGACCGRQSW